MFSLGLQNQRRPVDPAPQQKGETQMNTIVKKLCLLGAVIMASVQVSFAAVVSTRPYITAKGFTTTPVLVQSNESITYLIYSTGALLGVNTATVAVQYSYDLSNWQTEVTTAPCPAPFWRITDVTSIKPLDAYYRFNVLGSSGGSIVMTMSDTDDPAVILKSNKGLDTVVVNDDSLYVRGTISAERYRMPLLNPATAIILTTATQMQYGAAVSVDRIWYPWGETIGLTSGTIKLNGRFNVITNTGSATSGGDIFQSSLCAKPTISTETSVNGDIVTFLCAKSTITFQDQAILAGSGLKLSQGISPAGIRQCGQNDIIEFLFYNGIWRERLYINHESD